MLLGPRGCCLHEVSCLTFAHQQLTTAPLHKALWRIVRRVLSCYSFR